MRPARPKSDRAGHALIVTGGPFRNEVLQHANADLPSSSLVVAADGGAQVALRLGLQVDILVGDLDSADAVAIAEAGEVRRHHVDKDETDLELALATVVGAGISSATVIATLAGRVDHALGNLLVAASDQWSSLQIDLRVDYARGWVVRDTRCFSGQVGDTVSLLAVGGPALGVTTRGLRWQLNNATLEPGLGVGLSNRLNGTVAEVDVSSGTLLVLHVTQE